MVKDKENRSDNTFQSYVIKDAERVGESSRMKDKQLMQDITNRMFQIDYDRVKPGFDVSLRTGLRRAARHKRKAIPRVYHHDLRIPLVSPSFDSLSPPRRSSFLLSKPANKAIEFEDVDIYPRRHQLSLGTNLSSSKDYYPLIPYPRAPTFEADDIISRIRAKSKTPAPSLYRNVLADAEYLYQPRPLSYYSVNYAPLGSGSGGSKMLEEYDFDGVDIDGPLLSSSTRQKITDSHADLDEYERMLESVLSRKKGVIAPYRGVSLDRYSTFRPYQPTYRYDDEPYYSTAVLPITRGRSITRVADQLYSSPSSYIPRRRHSLPRLPSTRYEDSRTGSLHTSTVPHRTRYVSYDDASPRALSYEKYWSPSYWVPEGRGHVHIYLNENNPPSVDYQYGGQYGGQYSGQYGGYQSSLTSTPYVGYKSYQPLSSLTTPSYDYLSSIVPSYSYLTSSSIKPPAYKYISSIKEPSYEYLSTVQPPAYNYISSITAPTYEYLSALQPPAYDYLTSSSKIKPLTSSYTSATRAIPSLSSYLTSVTDLPPARDYYHVKPSRDYYVSTITTPSYDDIDTSKFYQPSYVSSVKPSSTNYIRSLIPSSTYSSLLKSDEESTTARDISGLKHSLPYSTLAGASRLSSHYVRPSGDGGVIGGGSLETGLPATYKRAPLSLDYSGGGSLELGLPSTYKPAPMSLDYIKHVPLPLSVGYKRVEDLTPEPKFEYQRAEYRKPPVSDTRKMLRDVICRSRRNPYYYDS